MATRQTMCIIVARRYLRNEAKRNGSHQLADVRGCVDNPPDRFAVTLPCTGRARWFQRPVGEADPGLPPRSNSTDSVLPAIHVCHPERSEGSSRRGDSSSLPLRYRGRSRDGASVVCRVPSLLRMTHDYYGNQRYACGPQGRWQHDRRCALSSRDGTCVMKRNIMERIRPPK